MQYRPSAPYPMYHEMQQARRGRRPAAPPPPPDRHHRHHRSHQHPDMHALAAYSHPSQFDRHHVARYQQMEQERAYVQHVEATIAAQRAAYHQLASMHAMQAAQPPRAHQAVVAQRQASRQQSQERPAHDGDPPMAHQASTLQKRTYQQLADKGRMDPNASTHNKQVSTSEIEAFHQHMHMERMRASQISNNRETATDQPLHAAHPAIPLPSSHNFNSQMNYQRHDATHMQHAPYPSLPHQAVSVENKDRARRNQRAEPRTSHRPDPAAAKMNGTAGVPNCYHPIEDRPTPKTYVNKKKTKQRPDHQQNTQWPHLATHTSEQAKGDVLGAAHVTYQPSTDTFATAHVAYQPNTQSFTKSEIIYQPRTNMLAAKQFVYQPGTDMIATAETVYQPETNTMATRQTMFQPQEEVIRTKEAVYQPQADILATRETNYQYRKNLVNTTETIYHHQGDINMENHKNSPPTANKQQQQTEKSEISVHETQKATSIPPAPILREILCLKQNQDEFRPPSDQPNENQTTKDSSEQNQQGNVNERKTTRQRKSATPKKTLRQTRKRKLSTEADCAPESQALVPTNTNPLTGSEWLTRLESLALARTKSPEQPRGQPAAKRPVGRPRTRRHDEGSPEAPQPESTSARTAGLQPLGPLVSANYWQTQASTSNSQVTSYHTAL